jgi:hypothetical protein
MTRQPEGYLPSCVLGEAPDAAKDATSEASAEITVQETTEASYLIPGPAIESSVPVRPRLSSRLDMPLHQVMAEHYPEQK